MGGISLLLALLGLQILPINIVGIALILFGVLLMVLDVFTPTNGILTAGGVISLVMGSLSLFDVAGPVLALNWPTIAITVGTLTAIFVFIISKGLFAQRRRHVPLTTMVGVTGVAKDDLTPEGWVMIKGEYWLARAEGEPIHAGDAVEVIRQDGRYLVVRRR
jgi:membrane-bound serine protease (ClpP class)